MQEAQAHPNQRYLQVNEENNVARLAANDLTLCENRYVYTLLF